MPSSPPTLHYRDRETGEILVEQIFGGGTLGFLYGNPVGRALAFGPLTTRMANRLYGLRQRSRASRTRIAEFVSSLGIDASEAEHPLDSYASLDDFFTRRLKPYARPIDRTPAHLVSPADGRALAFSRVASAGLVVKGSRVTLGALLGDEALAASYTRGACVVVIRLAPADYHRFHFPDDGAASAPRTIAGRLHSVHPLALEAGAPSFVNHRVITRLETDRFGEVTLVDVGALLVGTIVETYEPGRVTRGAEKGYFRFGGSTIVLVMHGDRVTIDRDLLDATADGIESRVRMGARIASAAS